MNKTSLIKQVSLVLGSSLLMTGCVVREEVRYRNPPPPPPPPVAVVAPGAEVEVSGAPPADIVEVQTVAPAPVGFIWVGGFWGWGARGWVWTPGRWARPPHPGAIWIGPRYVYRGGRHVWVRGGWR